jgi:hypothetical protein
MSYLGNNNLPWDISRSSPIPTDAERFSGNSSTTTFTLTRSVNFPTDLEVFVENIQQEPTGAYSVNGNSLIFTEAPPTGTNNVYVVYRNYQSGAQVSLPDGSITYSKLANNIRVFTTDNFSPDGNTSSFTLTESPADANTVFVTVDGVMQRAPAHYTTTGRTITFTSAPPLNANVHIRHLGFRTTSTVTALPANSNISQPTLQGTTTSNGSLTFVGSGNRFTGDFTNATVTNRLLFQTSNTNSSTGIYAVPNGSSTASSWQAANTADPTNASKILIATNGSTDVQLVSGINGTGTYLPLTFYNSGAEKMRLDANGNVMINTTTTQVGAKLAVTGGIQGTIANTTAINAATGSPTSVDFTGIPSWVKRIQVSIVNLSTTGSSNLLVRIGNATFTTSGYSSVMNYVNPGANSCTGDYETSGFRLTKDWGSSGSWTGTFTLVLHYNYVYTSSFVGMSGPSGAGKFGSGYLSLGSVLDRIRVTTVNGTDTFDAGTINIFYEG